VEGPKLLSLKLAGTANFCDISITVADVYPIILCVSICALIANQEILSVSKSHEFKHKFK
jgi:hypothetical protein